jgi:GNAT superfamily N-acetyltransferase
MALEHSSEGSNVAAPAGDSAMIIVRHAGIGDIATIARHRAAMFADMGVLAPASTAELIDRTVRYLEVALPAGEYLGWLAELGSQAKPIVGGAGVQLRRVLPFPELKAQGPTIAGGRQGIVLNVYTEPTWRRRGVARRLMESVLSWASEAELESLVLHASEQGRTLYEQLGFAPTNEMRLVGK